MDKYLVEVDVHTLELEVGRAIVAVGRQCFVSARFPSSQRTLQSHQDHARQRWSARKQHRFGYPEERSNVVQRRIIIDLSSRIDRSEGEPRKSESAIVVYMVC